MKKRYLAFVFLLLFLSSCHFSQWVHASALMKIMKNFNNRLMLTYKSDIPPDISEGASSAHAWYSIKEDNVIYTLKVRLFWPDMSEKDLGTRNKKYLADGYYVKSSYDIPNTENCFEFSGTLKEQIGMICYYRNIEYLFSYTTEYPEKERKKQITIMGNAYNIMTDEIHKYYKEKGE